MGAGLAVGFGSALWAQHKVRTVAARYSPNSLAGVTMARARDFPGEVKAAVREGREAMREREAELRSGSGSRGRRPATRP